MEGGDCVDIGEKIKLLLEAKKMSNLELSKLSGVPNSTLADILNGKTSRVSINAVINIADALGVTLEYLVGKERQASAAPPLSAEAQRVAVLYENATDLQKTIVRTTLEYDAPPKLPPLPTDEETAAELEELSFQNPLRAMIRDESS